MLNPLFEVIGFPRMLGGSPMAKKDDDDEQGAFRWGDPETSKGAARAIRVGPIMRRILKYLASLQQPRNGWEISKAMETPTITVVPRLAPMRRNGLIELQGERPGPPPKFMPQGAYVITDFGRQVLEPPPPINIPSIKIKP